jgi:hypothetical protein
VRWTRLGDESTKFFHAIATKRFRINTITSLDTDDGRTLCDHAEKATLLWEAYRKRIGCSNQVAMHYALQELVQNFDLHQIGEVVTKEEIDRVIKNPTLG